MNEFIQQFILESRDLVDQAGVALMTLEEAPNDAEALDAAFRAIHTLKGGAAIVEFAAMERLVHGIEDGLSAARAGKRSVTTDLLEECVACLDQVGRWLDSMEKSGELPVAMGTAPNAGDHFSAAIQSDWPAVELPDPGRSVLRSQLQLLTEEQVPLAPRIASAGRVAANVLHYFGREADVALVTRATEEAISTRQTKHLREAIETLVDAGPPTATNPSKLLGQPHPESIVRTLRVDAERVDALVRLTGELTVVKNAIGHILKLAESTGNDLSVALKTPHGDLHHLIGELQRAVLGVRVVPFRTVFQRFPRLVREISANLDKPVRLQIEGEDTEADKAIVEMLFEPLLHIVRNAMDHGIEPAEVRRQRSKPALATLRITASRQAGQVLVEVEDDGGGVDTARVRAVAKERAVVNAETLGAMNDEEIVDLIFAAGFSTATRVTELSGRGVGMDAVRSAVERVGGQVVIESRLERGAKVRLTLPYSVMVTQVMTVEAGGQMFGIPLEAIVETVSIPEERIMGVGAARAFIQRDRTVPVFRLASLLQAPDSHEKAGANAVIVIASVAGQLGGFQVNRVGEPIEVMLKPLAGLLQDIRGIAGTTILGDGRVLIVLDLSELLR